MSLSAQVQCEVVNAFATTFLPAQHVASFCSAWLQTPVETVTWTRLAMVAPITVTKSLSRSDQTATTTRILTTTATVTSTSELWRATPACSTVPTFDHIRARERKDLSAMSRMLDSACKCISAPASTSTVVRHPTSTPVVQVTVLPKDQPCVTDLVTITEVATSTRSVFLGRGPAETPAEHSVYESAPTYSAGSPSPRVYINATWETDFVQQLLDREFRAHALDTRFP